MDAAILAVGSEMLTPGKLDTNSLFITERLNELGVEVVEKAIVGDDRARLTTAIQQTLERVQILVLSGGLGPTEDDVTRDAAAAALGRKLQFNESVFETIALRFARMGRRMSENNKRQAYVIQRAEVIPNDRGTAPGLWLEDSNRIIMLLPGPPKELKAMWDLQCHARLKQKLPSLAIGSVTLRIAGMGESEVDQIIAPIYTKYTNPACTILAGASEITVHLRARAASAAEAERLVSEVAAPIEQLLGDRVYSRDGSSLEETLIRLLKEHRQTCAVAESCTGGLVGQRLTSVPGSSEAFLGGIISYSGRVKQSLLGVPKDVIASHGEVSEQVAAGMAAGAKEQMGSHWALSITGYAGPDGGTEKDPVGTVYLGLAGPAGVSVKRYFFLGDRERIRSMAAQTALDLLRRAILARAAVRGSE